jgi:hypothetical protein
MSSASNSSWQSFTLFKFNTRLNNLGGVHMKADVDFDDFFEDGVYAIHTRQVNHE